MRAPGAPVATQARRDRILQQVAAALRKSQHHTERLRFRRCGKEARNNSLPEGVAGPGPWRMHARTKLLHHRNPQRQSPHLRRRRSCSHAAPARRQQGGVRSPHQPPIACVSANALLFRRACEARCCQGDPGGARCRCYVQRRGSAFWRQGALPTHTRLITVLAAGDATEVSGAQSPASPAALIGGLRQKKACRTPHLRHPENARVHLSIIGLLQLFWLTNFSLPRCRDWGGSTFSGVFKSQVQ